MKNAATQNTIFRSGRYSLDLKINENGTKMLMGQKFGGSKMLWGSKMVGQKFGGGVNKNLDNHFGGSFGCAETECVQHGKAKTPFGICDDFFLSKNLNGKTGSFVNWRFYVIFSLHFLAS